MDREDVTECASIVVYCFAMMTRLNRVQSFARTLIGVSKSQSCIAMTRFLKSRLTPKCTRVSPPINTLALRYGMMWASTGRAHLAGLPSLCAALYSRGRRGRTPFARGARVMRYVLELGTLRAGSLCSMCWRPRRMCGICGRCGDVLCVIRPWKV